MKYNLLSVLMQIITPAIPDSIYDVPVATMSAQYETLDACLRARSKIETLLPPRPDGRHIVLPGSPEYRWRSICSPVGR